MASGAYINVSPDGCTVLTSALPVSGSSTWCPLVNPGVGYSVANWNKLYPAYALPCHPHCPGCVQSTPPTPPSATVPPPAPPPPPPAAGVPPTETPPSAPQKPVTGPKEPDPCAPAMAQRVGDDVGFDTQEHLTMPRVGEFHFVRHGNVRGLTAEPPTTSGASYVKAPDVRANGKGGLITVADLGTGDGYVVLHPSDINEFGLRGDSVHPEGAWPAAISRVALLLLNAERNANTTGDDAKTYLAFGLPSARPEQRGKPRSGVYFDFDPATGVLNIQHTDADGLDATVSNGVTVDGLPIGGGSVTFPLEAPDNATGAQYAFDAGTVVGSDLAGMGFDQNVQEGPAFYDINGDNQLYITSAGVTIPGKLTVTGLIDPTGLELTPVAANPGGTAANTLWLDSVNSNRLRWGADYLLKGSLGATDNAAPRTNGTGENALQGSAFIINDVSSASLLLTADGNVTDTLALRPADTLAVATGPSLNLDAAQGSATPGNVDIGTTNAEAVAIGRTGKTTTIRGSGRVNQMAHFVGAFAGAAGDDVAVGAVSCFRVTSGTTLTGMVPANGGTAVDGQLVIVVNETGGNLTLTHDATSTAANRLMMAGGANLTLSRYSAALFRYSTADSRWRHVGEAGGGSGGGIDEGVSAGLNFWGAW